MSARVSDLVSSAIVRTHLSRSHAGNWVVALLYEAYLLWLAVTLMRNVIDNVYSAINELFLWE